MSRFPLLSGNAEWEGTGSVSFAEVLLPSIGAMWGRKGSGYEREGLGVGFALLSRGGCVEPTPSPSLS